MKQPPTIAIVGIGGVFPGAEGLETFQENIMLARDSVREPPAGRWLLDLADVYDPSGPQPDRIYSRRACFVDDFGFDDPDLKADPQWLATLDPMYRLLLKAGCAVWRDGVTANVDRRRAGIIIGNIVLPTAGAAALAEEIVGPLLERSISSRVSPTEHKVNRLNRYVAGLPAGLLARALGIGGGSYTLDAACASSLYAIKYAVDELQAGRADLMLAGGLSRPDSLYTQMGFSALHAISRSGRCAPFDRRADGLVVGEGAGLVMLKRLEDALRDGDRIYATIAGIGLSNDIEGNLMSPASEGQLRAMRAAYAAAGWRPGVVDLIECHGTGTPVGDAVEFNSLRTLWRDESRERRCIIGSVKSNVGHLLTAAGAAGLIKTLLAMQAGRLPPTANFEAPGANIDLEYSPFAVLAEARPWEQRDAATPRRAAVSAFGFGGINAHLLIEEWREAPVAYPRLQQQTEPPPPIAVVGMAACFGPWRDLAAIRGRVFDREMNSPTAQPVTGWGHDTGLRGFLMDKVEVPVGRFRIPPTELQDMLPQQLLMLQVAADALAAAGISVQGEEALPDAGVFIGIGLDLNTTNFHLRWSLLNRAREWRRDMGLALDEREFQQWVTELRDACHPPLTANRTMGALGGIVASRIARAFRIGGPSFTVANEEASGLRALAMGVRALQRGEIRAAIVGAVDLAGDIRAVLAQADTRPFTNQTQCAPFGQEADGSLVGEGAAAFVLKTLADAERDGDVIHAVIAGLGAASGGDMGAVIPPAAVCGAAMRAACHDAGIEPGAIGHIEAHGSACPAEDAEEIAALEEFLPSRDNRAPVSLGSAMADFGHCGAAAGMAALTRAILCLEERQQASLRGWHQQPLPKLHECRDRLAPPAFARPWLRNRADGPRRVLVNNLGSDGNCLSAALAQHDGNAAFQETGLRPGDPGLFSVNGADTTELLRGLGELAGLDRNTGAGELAARWWRSGRYREGARSINLIASDPRELAALIDKARLAIETGIPGADPNLHYLPVPEANRGGLAFVFPGSGNHFPGMGREAGLRWPQVLKRLDDENGQLAAQFAGGGFWRDNAGDDFDCRDFIFGQVWFGTFMSDVIRLFGIEPEAIIGYSLGETAGLFATRAWTDRDLMLQRIKGSRLFTHELAGPCEAARRLWGAHDDEPIQWQTGVVPVPADRLREALQGKSRVYLSIVNTDTECVIGGERRAVQELVAALGCNFHPVEGVTSVHCEVARSVAKEYRDLHLFPTTPPAGVRFYSGILGRAYPVDQDSAADSIVGQAVAPFDFTRVIRSAWDDGIRTFIELGPGATCTRMIGQILNDRPHRAQAISARGQNEVLNILRALAFLRASGRPVDLAPLYPARETLRDPWEGHARISISTTQPEIRLPLPALRDQPARVAAQADTGIAQILTAFQRVEAAKAESHAAFLRVANGITTTLAQAYALQREIGGGAAVPVESGPQLSAVTQTSDMRREVRFDRGQCLEFARGSIGRMLGPDYAASDVHPTRVRLPDEPLMLVDRILTVEGEPHALGTGRVVTEHDVLPGAWYLDHNRIPTCIAVEAGQADLFLSAWLGIDERTRGLAVYRLLDAEITLHGPLPQPGQTIRYDIHIDHFFRQGETWLFRFHFDGTVDGKPLITMRNGCAGFFSAAELEAGRGIVLTRLEQQPQPGKRPADWKQLAPMRRERYDAAQVEALRRGDLADCFGPDFARLPLKQPSGLPGGRMTLVHRVLDLDPEGGRYGIGLITGEADIGTDDWFLTCHFVDDRVMPGTLMYECCLHTLRVFLMRLGWVGETAEAAYEPMPGVSSRLKCRGQVIPGTRTVQYAITLKEYGYDATGTPYAIADALMSADGRPIVQMSDMSLRLSGLQRDRIEALWAKASGESEHVPTSPGKALFDQASITEFAIGKPSLAFGDRYRVFDDKRVIARLPRPPFQFLDRIVAIENCRPWELRPGGEIVAEYDVPPEAWYFREARRPHMPFAVLLEVALQPCGWLAAYLGSALTSEVDLCFRNLGGSARQLLPVGPDAGTLSTRIRITRASASGGMLIQNYDFEVSGPRGVIYQGDTYFGFFSREALANQVGLREVSLANIPAGSEGCEYPSDPPFPGPMLRMIDAIDHYDPKGGARGLGLIQGSVRVNPGAWFFKAHFHQDPVWPGSLGLESFLQILEYAARRHWADAGAMQLTGTHQWTYRGQILPTDSKVTVQAEITALDHAARSLSADGLLSVDGRIIYRMQDFQLKLAP
ncbi:MAG: type I polyketide synthase [Gammaproteobacteria bacterium]|nr:MAG: type I polyketide synthase [Gammaproteobacteria bacterium]